MMKAGYRLSARPRELNWAFGVILAGITAAAVLFLGTAWSAAGHLRSGASAAANRALLVLAVLGLMGSTLVAGRIAYVIARTQRRGRRASRSGRPA